jgi:ABC-2 type transport system permease protein
VLSASVYIAVCTARNRIRVRLKRLREPRYLIGAVVGAAYLYFAVFARGRRPGVRVGRGRSTGGPAELPPAFQVTGTALVGLAVMVLAALAWVLPADSGLLTFSEAEKAFLFPAPVTRRQLLVHRIVRSQTGSLVASLFIAVFATPFAGLMRLRLAIGFWVLLVTIRVYYAAVELTRARLRSPVAAMRLTAWLPVGLLVAGLCIVGFNVARELNQPAAGISDVMVHLSRVTSSGVTHAVLWPFIAVVRAPFAQTAAAFVPGILSALVVLGALTAWMLLSDATFDVVVEGSQARAALAQQTSAAQPRARNVGWTLPLAGRPEMALLWKGAMQTLRAGNVSAWRYVPPMIGALIGVLGISSALMGAGKMQGPAAFVSILGAMIGAVAIILGPLMARGDLRTDFEHLDLLKTWPMRAGDVIRGEIAWPVLLVSSVAWVGMLTAALFSSTALPTVSFISRWSFALAAAFAGPALIAAQFAVHSSATIFFPAWVQLGSQRTRGLDMMGQRLIMLAAIIISLLLFAVPGAIGGGVVWLIFHRFVGDVVFVPSAIVFAAIVLVEVLAVTELLGPAYERIDVTSVERGE